MNEFITNLEKKIQALEQNLETTRANIKSWTEGFHGITGMIQASKETLDDAKKMASALTEQLPESENVANV